MAAVRPEVKDDSCSTPWESFPQGDHLREAIHLLHTGSSSVRIGAGVVSGMCANGIRSADGLRAAVDDLATG
ncbi:hypothetical protein ACIQCQ_25430 [Streptomyces sp. NPDC088394]|uniref:hypothetical protein n=1 Tax=Streptomyces sp. NPDC088394 TaxID=3365860 RepID=UPI00381616E8